MAAEPIPRTPERLLQTLDGRSHLLYEADRERAGRRGGRYEVALDPEVAGADRRTVVHDPALARRLLRAHPAKPAFPYGAVFVGEGLLGQTDLARWRAQRRWVRPALRAAEVRQHHPVVAAEAATLASALASAAAVGTPVDVHPMLARCTFRMLGRALLLGATMTAAHETAAHEYFDDDAKCDALRAAFDAGLQPHYRETSSGQRAHATLDGFARAVLAAAETRERRGGGGGATFVARLVDPDPASPYAGRPDLRIDELLTTAFAGHETTANTAAWCLYELSRHPAQQSRVREAVARACAAAGATDPAALSYAQLNAIAELTGAVRETLRLWPVVANGAFRCSASAAADADDKADDRDAAVPEQFQVPHWLLHRDPAHWGDDAGAFDIDRPGDRDNRWCEAAFMPFSVPPRDCIGRHLALLELRALVAAVLFAVELRPPPRDRGQRHEGAKRGRNWATLAPEDGVRLRVRPVRPAAAAAPLRSSLRSSL